LTPGCRNAASTIFLRVCPICSVDKTNIP